MRGAELVGDPFNEPNRVGILKKSPSHREIQAGPVPEYLFISTAGITHPGDLNPLTSLTKGDYRESLANPL
jgi:hypothetical protein